MKPFPVDGVALDVFGYLTEPWQEDWKHTPAGTDLSEWSSRYHVDGWASQDHLTTISQNEAPG